MSAGFLLYTAAISLMYTLPVGIIAKVGTNPSGLRVVTQADYHAEKEAALTPSAAQKMRREISNLYQQAYRLEQSDREDNVSGPMIIRGRAKKMLEEWRKMYPQEAAEEKRSDLLYKAKELRDKATGALLYDCDGMLSWENQQAGREDFIAKAEALEAEAAKI